jgi:hypothetical protein
MWAAMPTLRMRSRWVAVVAVVLVVFITRYGFLFGSCHVCVLTPAVLLASAHPRDAKKPWRRSPGLSGKVVAANQVAG